LFDDFPACSGFSDCSGFLGEYSDWVRDASFLSILAGIGVLSVPDFTVIGFSQSLISVGWAIVCLAARCGTAGKLGSNCTPRRALSAETHCVFSVAAGKR